jgi:hypothetical protein
MPCCIAGAQEDAGLHAWRGVHVQLPGWLLTGHAIAAAGAVGTYVPGTAVSVGAAIGGVHAELLHGHLALHANLINF